MILILYDWLNAISAAFQLHFMALAIDVIDRSGPSSKMCHQLHLMKNKVTLILSVYITAEGILPTLKSLTKQSALVLKVGVTYRWQSV